MNFLVRLILNAITLLVIAMYVPGFHVTTFYTALLAAFIISILNVLIKPILIVLTLPITILTLGLFALIINIFLFMFASYIVKGFTIDSLTAGIIGWLLYTIIGVAVNKLVAS